MASGEKAAKQLTEARIPLYADYLVHEYGARLRLRELVGRPSRCSDAVCDRHRSVPPTLEKGRGCGPRRICSVTRTQPISCGLDGTQPMCSDGWDTRIYKPPSAPMPTCLRKTWARCSPVASENLQHRHRRSHERVVATLRLRIRALEEINRELKEQLEAAYGRLAVVQPKLGSLYQTSG